MTIVQKKSSPKFARSPQNQLIWFQKILKNHLKSVCSEQELKVLEIRKNILPQCLEKWSEGLPEKYLIETSDLSKKKLFSPIRSPSSLLEKRISAHKSEKHFGKEGGKIVLFRLLLLKVFQIFLLTSHSSNSATSKAPSLHSSNPSKKKPSGLSKSS